MSGKDTTTAVTVQSQVEPLRRRWPLLLLLIFLASVQGHGHGHVHQLQVGSHKLCGQALSDAMDVVCAHGYNTLPQKRSEPLDGAAFALSPLLSSLYGAEVLIQTRRHRRQRSSGGIYDECCVLSCSYQELASYCLPK
ncbi:probable insulin-like peptide 1 [Drosophila guanche]|uniref:Blast:Probable insulin-like peptide 1 n=1 Tax=Drosophila guanche TaxID=7266 RepID=A0A3B0KLK5_DROGU|nr:probable insulin-like peptide 1 [Drosophila guanche]SPP87459.1 blast:Probable insulin-like peptide 1 [Drosophila guanche]